MNRRSLLKSLGATVALSIAGFGTQPLLANNFKKKKTLRFAHITDVHMQPGFKAPKGFEKCLHHIQNQKEPVNFIMNGGDTIMDALHTKKHKVKKQWRIYNEVLKNECSLKVFNCLGNHDVWGIGDHDLLAGKSWAFDMMQLEKGYYSFDAGGWHFIVLDSIHQREDESWYMAKLDEVQFEWLRNDLQNTPTNMHVVILSHIPILFSDILSSGSNELGNLINFKRSWMHNDAQEITELFGSHNNVKLCLSGHLHVLDKVNYNGVKYLCNGAVSGNWWWGNYKNTPPGYAIVTLYDDGSFENQYVKYK